MMVRRFSSFLFRRVGSAVVWRIAGWLKLNELQPLGSWVFMIWTSEQHSCDVFETLWIELMSSYFSWCQLAQGPCCLASQGSSPHRWGSWLFVANESARRPSAQEMWLREPSTGSTTKTRRRLLLGLLRQFQFAFAWLTLKQKVMQTKSHMMAPQHSAVSSQSPPADGWRLPVYRGLQNQFLPKHI